MKQSVLVVKWSCWLLSLMSAVLCQKGQLCLQVWAASTPTATASSTCHWDSMGAGAQATQQPRKRSSCAVKLVFPASVCFAVSIISDKSVCVRCAMQSSSADNVQFSEQKTETPVFLFGQQYSFVQRGIYQAFK